MFDLVEQALKIFCDSLKSLGDLWTTEKWMMRCSYDSCTRLENIEFERIALLMLEDIIPVARERMFDGDDDDDDDDMRDYSPPANAFSKALFDSYSDTTSFPGSPMTPTSVLPGCWRSSSPSEKGSYSPPMLLPLRVQAVGKLSPIDVKRLSFYMLPHAAAIAQDPKYHILTNTMEEEERATAEMQQSGYQGDEEMINVVIHTPEMETHTANTAGSFNQKVGVAGEVVPLPSSQPMLFPKNEPVPPPPPPPPPTAPRNVAVAPPPPPPPTSTSQSSVLTLPPSMSTGPPPPPPSPMSASKGNGPPPPPPPIGASLPKGNGSAPPPPPGVASLRTKKLATKLKRSSQMGNLYRTLRGKVEGSNSPGKSSGRKGKVGGSPAGGKQGMADALAEMTKR